MVPVAPAECNMAVFVLSNIDQGYHGKFKMKSTRQVTLISTPPVWRLPRVRSSYSLHVGGATPASSTSMPSAPPTRGPIWLWCRKLYFLHSNKQ